jgi:2-polyprenyl-3-methyl-5-hydroxy-6-metoxy-1,4-benzoquinol methylase
MKTELTKSQIERLNAAGPYEHGSWFDLANGDPKLHHSTSGQVLFGARSNHLVAEISRILTSLYSADEIREMSILDVGCYDGWILTSLTKNLTFKSSTGIEPRQKNINKGITARDILDISTPIEFIQGDLETLNHDTDGREFDIVLCLGTIHHVESTIRAVKHLTKATRKLLIIDTMVIPHATRDKKQILKFLNLKDIVYLNRAQSWGLAAFKFESPYLDGSTSGTRIVNVPDQELVEMSLEVENFSIVSTNRPDKHAYSKDFQKLRGVKELLIAATPSKAAENQGLDSWRAKARMHESIFCLEHTSPYIVAKWIKFLDIGIDLKSLKVRRKFSVAVSNWVSLKYSMRPLSMYTNFLMKFFEVGEAKKQILQNLSRSPHAKVLLEAAKIQLSDGEIMPAKVSLMKIIEIRDADWRSFYRACYLLSETAKTLGENVESVHYKSLLQISNAEFPLTRADFLHSFPGAAV